MSPLCRATKTSGPLTASCCALATPTRRVPETDRRIVHAGRSVQNQFSVGFPCRGKPWLLACPTRSGAALRRQARRPATTHLATPETSPRNQPQKRVPEKSPFRHQSCGTSTPALCISTRATMNTGVSRRPGDGADPKAAAPEKSGCLRRTPRIGSGLCGGCGGRGRLGPHAGPAFLDTDPRAVRPGRTSQYVPREWRPRR
jgi:hypothetical protein